MKSYIYFPVIIFFIFCGKQSYAVKEIFHKEIQGTTIKPNAGFKVRDDKFQTAHWTDGTIDTMLGSDNLIIFELNEDTDMVLPASFTCTVNLRVWHWNAAGTKTSVDISLSIAYDSATATPFNYRTIYHELNYYKDSVKILTVNYNGGLTTNPPDFFRLAAEIQSSRIYSFNCSTTPTFPSNPYVFPTNTFLQTVQWSKIDGADEYDFEWTFYDDSSDVMQTYVLTPDSVVFVDLFKNNATRVVETENKYTINKIYTGGYVFYRVRGVHYDAKGRRIVSNWSTKGGTIGNPITRKFQVNWYYPDFNWTASTIFSEEGKKKSTVSYFDGSQRSRQTVSTLNSDTCRVITETLYDHQGRPAVSVLSTPALGWNTNYFSEFNQHDGLVYNRTYFDTGQCSFSPLPMDTTEGTSKYYSSHTETSFPFHDYIPRANGYPFTVTEYTPDLTGRISRQSGLGNTLKLGSDHETKYFYGIPAQEEMDRVFGNEVGDAGHYLKNMVIDPNGQISVSYLDAHGRTIATALTGSVPSNLNALPSSTSPHFLDVNLLTNNNKLGSSLSNHYSLLASNAGDYTFKYGAAKAEWKPACLDSSVCYDCYYNFLLRITDNCSNHTLPGDSNFIREFNNFPLGFDTLCNNSNGWVYEDTTLSLSPASYEIQKTATVSQAAIDYYAKRYLIDNQCIIPFDTFLVHATDAIDFSGCNMTCEECNNALGTESDYIDSYIDKVIASGKTPTDVDTTIATDIYAQMKAECAEICKGTSPCAELYDQMVQDVSMGGQYGSYTYNNTSQIFSCSDPNSVFYSTYWRGPNPAYHDELGAPSYILYNDSLYPPEGVPSLTIFLSHWQPTWGESLVKKHPEFCYWQFCNEDSASENYDEKLLDEQQYDLAFDDGYLNPLDTISAYPSLADPFFATGGFGHGVKPLMANKMEHYFIHDTLDLSMWEFATAMIVCHGSLTCAEIFGSSCEGDNDAEWSLFRSLYLNTKYYFLDSIREVYVTHNCDLVSNKCIGLGNRPWLINNSYINTDSCSYDDLYYGYQPHVIHWGTYGPSPTYAGDSEVVAAEAEAFTDSLITANCDSACVHHALNWYNQLAYSGCLSGLGDSAEFVNAMIEVCETGCGFDHPFGMTVLPPGVTSPNGYTSLADVLDQLLGIPPDDTTACNALHLTITNTYSAYPSTTVITFDTCLCNQLAAYKDSFGITTDYYALSDSLLARYGYTMTAYDLNVLDAGCNTPKCSHLVEPVQIAPFMVCGPKPCIDCAAMQHYQHEFVETFLTTDFADYSSLFAGFINQQTGFNLLFEDYENFMDSCEDVGYVFPDSIVYAKIDTTWSGSDTTYNITLNLAYDAGSNTLSSDPNDYGISFISDDLPNPGSIETGDMINATVIDSFCYLSDFLLNTFNTGYPAYQITLGFSGPITVKGGHFIICSSCLPFALDCQISVNPPPLAVYTLIAVDTIHKSCFGSKLLCNTPPQQLGIDTVDCMDQLFNMAAANAQASYDSYIDSVTQDFVTDYISECIQLQDTFTVREPFNEHHYTLYYYDQAGNLVKTIPPRGVDTLSASERITVASHRSNSSNPAEYPLHSDSTRYWYNSLNQPTKQTTIDGGVTLFWYDRIGRLVVSQSARQAPDSAYSYTLYDGLGRIIEVGQLTQVHAMKDDTSMNATSLSKWIENGTDREQVTSTYYDATIVTIPNLTQENLRNRVATVTFKAVYDTSKQTYDQATHYSYDVEGNVKTLVQDNPSLASFIQRYKRIDYDYDLISGKVDHVFYQKDSADQFVHEYQYDEENRLIQAKTSADNWLFDIDASYQYYNHGPLSRVELGQRQIQGIDYAYTIQGWLKGINGLNKNLTFDMGHDGNPKVAANKRFGRDVYGEVIDYFAGDYYPAGGNTKNFEPSYGSSTFAAASSDLFNGNIKNVGYTIYGLRPLTIGYAYKYDQLNRLNEKNSYKNFDAANYKWATSGSAMTAYKELLSYDANGNILTYLRRGDTAQVDMDSLTYLYTSGTNQLRRVRDKSTYSSNYSDDIDDQSNNNYTYDESGNLISDTQEGLTITWTAYGKVDSINNSNTNLAINFKYDPSGNRVSKRVINTSSHDTTTTYYVRDAQGNILSTYSLNEDTVRWSEQHVYGSSRLGILYPDSVVYPKTTHSQYYHNWEGKKLYELTNHLGNVLAVISDKKLGKDTTSSGPYDYWMAAELNRQDYYTSGSFQPLRNSNTIDYNFGYQGSLKDNEIKGYGNSYSTEFRELDPRLIRWWSIDPNFQGVESPYIGMGNNPVFLNDQKGDIATDGDDPKKKISSDKQNPVTTQPLKIEPINPSTLSLPSDNLTPLKAPRFIGRSKTSFLQPPNDQGFNTNLGLSSGFEGVSLGLNSKAEGIVSYKGVNATYNFNTQDVSVSYGDPEVTGIGPLYEHTTTAITYVVSAEVIVDQSSKVCLGCEKILHQPIIYRINYETLKYLGGSFKRYTVSQGGSTVADYYSKGISIDLSKGLNKFVSATFNITVDGPWEPVPENK